MGSYRREYEEYYNGIMDNKNYDYRINKDLYRENDLYIKPRMKFDYRNDIYRGNYYKKTNEKSGVSIFLTEIIGSMLLFLILVSFSVLNGIGKEEMYKESKNIIEKNYTYDEVKDLFGIKNFIKDLEENNK